MQAWVYMALLSYSLFGKSAMIYIFFFLFFIYFGLFWGHNRSAQYSTPGFALRATPGEIQGTIWDAKD